MSNRNSLWRWIPAFCLLVLIAHPAWSADSVIANGIDVWSTPADGRTFVDFAVDPLPQGFFCSSSAPFVEKVLFKGRPIATSPSGGLGDVDTIVQRLDDARFNRLGVARTRIRMKALSLVSIEPIETACGRYEVAVSLTGRQPVTHMTIVREHSEGGRFTAPVAVRSKVTFTPLDGGEALEVHRGLRFANHSPAHWASRPGEGGHRFEGFILVDTDADGEPDTHVPGTSNFAAGWRIEAGRDGEGIRTKAEAFKEIIEHCCEGSCHIQ